MRNLEQYPITEDEIVQCLKELMDGFSYEKTGLVGDMRPLLLANAIRLILTPIPAQQTLPIRIPKVRTSHHRNKEEAARLQALVDKRCAREGDDDSAVTST